MSKTIQKIGLVILVIAILGVSSFVISGLADNSTKPEPYSTNSLEQISLEQAKTIALGVAEGVITEAVLTKEKGVLVYEIETTSGNLETEMKIDPSNGNILSIETEAEEEITVEELERIENEITKDRAKEIAINEVNGIVIGIDIEKEGRRILYEVQVQDGNDIAEVEIDAETGKVLEVEWGDDDE